jgi:Flp pilus assembly protein TadG
MGDNTMKISDSRRWKPSDLARAIRRFRASDSTGSALVEMALSLPIMLLVMTGIFSFSIALYQKLELAEAVSAGARVLAVDRGDTNPCSTAAAAIYAAAPTLSQAKMTVAFVLNGVSTGASCAGPSSGANTNMVSGGNAKVTVTYPCTIGVYNFSFPNCTLTSKLTEVVQ